MKTVTGITIATLVVSSPLVVRADDAEPVGRYQLLYAVTATTFARSKIAESGVTEQKGLWKIDTVTGQVWEYNSTVIQGVISEKFVPVETSKP